jgi:hypothetical protein
MCAYVILERVLRSDLVLSVRYLTATTGVMPDASGVELLAGGVPVGPRRALTAQFRPARPGDDVDRPC